MTLDQLRVLFLEKKNFKEPINDGEHTRVYIISLDYGDRWSDAKTSAETAKTQGQHTSCYEMIRVRL